MQNELIEQGVATMARWVANVPDVRVVWEDGLRPRADLKKREVYLPRLACASGVPEEARLMVRSMAIHAFKHQELTSDLAARTPVGKKFFLLNAIEDVRIDRHASEQLDGVRDVMAQSRAVCNRETAAKIAEGKRPDPVLEASIAMMYRLWGAGPLWKVSPEAQRLVDLGYEEFSRVRAAASTEDSLLIANRIWEIWREAEIAPGQGKQSASGKGEGEDGEKGEGEDSADGKAGKADKGEGESKGKTDGRGGDESSLLGGDAERGWLPNEVLGDRVERDLREFDAKNPKKYVPFTENDEHIVPDVDDVARKHFNRMFIEVNSKALGLARTLDQVLKTMAASRKETFLCKGKLDMKRLATIAVGTSKDVFYRVVDGQKLDTAVEIILDQSGSMKPSMDAARRSIAVIAEALNLIGVPFEIVGSSTTGRVDRSIDRNIFSRSNPIEYVHYKSFAEQWSAVRARIMSMRARANNIDGEVVEYAARRLAARRERRKVIFSFCDGCPCSGQGQIVDEAIAENLKDVCKRCRSSGIEVYAFGIETGYPARFYGREHFIELKSAGEMDLAFMRRLAEIVCPGRISA